MALVKCKKCGNIISDKARTCPKCGANVRADYILREEKPKSSSGVWWLLAVVVIIAAALLFTFSQKGSDVATNREAETEELSDSGVVQGRSEESNERVMTSNVDKTKEASGNELSQTVKDAHSFWAKLSDAGKYSDYKGAQFTIGYYYHNGRVRECSISILGDYQIDEKLQADIDDNGNLVCTGNCNYGKIKVVLYPKRIGDTLKGEMTIGNDKASPIEIYIEEYED